MNIARERRFAENLAAELVAMARTAGADAADATVGVSSSQSVTARDGEVERVTRSSSRGAGVRVIKDGRLGFATSAQAPTSPAHVRELVENALALAKLSSPSADNVILAALPSEGLEERISELALFDDECANADSNWATKHALAIERSITAHDGIVGIREVGAGSHWGVFALATDGGFIGSYAGASAQIYGSALAEDAGGKKRIGSDWHAARKLGDLFDDEAIAGVAAKRALAKIGARKINSAKLPIIFDAQMSRGFFAAILQAINGDAVAKEASFLANKFGQVVLRKGIVLRDDPFVVGGFGTRPFDGEGQPGKAVDLIDHSGKLTQLLLDGRSASKLNLAPSGHAARSAMGLPSPSSSNVVIVGGDGDEKSIIAETKRGLFVDSLMGHSPDMITGEYSRGASGFMIENGEITYPVEEITIASDMLTMMLGIDRVGADLDTRSSLHAPTIRFAQMSISGA